MLKFIHDFDPVKKYPNYKVTAKNSNFPCDKKV